MERMRAENRLTAEGRVLHATQTSGLALFARPRRRDAPGLAPARPRWSRRRVEFRRSGDIETPYPLEIKRGKPKAHRAEKRNSARRPYASRT